MRDRNDNMLLCFFNFSSHTNVAGTGSAEAQKYSYCSCADRTLFLFIGLNLSFIVQDFILTVVASLTTQDVRNIQFRLTIAELW